MSHPFGDLLSQHLHRKHGLSKSKLADGIDQPNFVISLMSQGQRLTGPLARSRVLAIIRWLHAHDALATIAEANALLLAAGMGQLNGADPDEAELRNQLADQEAPVVNTRSIEEAQPTTNIPLAVTSFIGRENELAKISRLLEQSRLVTLLGPGGTGKTRLALEVAIRRQDQYRDGVWLVELAALTEPVMVLQALATALQIREVAGQALVDTLISAIKLRDMLIILDNCEHLIEACASVAQQILRTCPHVRLLATSREALDIPGEQTFPVPPLAMPADELQVASSKFIVEDIRNTSQSSTFNLQLATILECEAVRLFAERARSVQPDFQLTAQTAPLVAHICQSLDGLPLAIELAAARVKVLSLEQIAERLDDRFRLLTGGGRTTLPRHQTLRALIDWSYSLLPEDEQAMLRRLSVFAGGWTLEAAEAICTGKGIEVGDVLDILTQLVNKSLVVVEYARTRYRLLETIRRYAAIKLEEAAETEMVEQRHADWFLQFASHATRHLAGHEQSDRLRRLETEHDNLRTALSNSLGTTAMLRLCATLGSFWRIRGYWSEGLDWLERALAYSNQAPGPERAEAIFWAATLAWKLGNTARANALSDQGLRLFQELGNTGRYADLLTAGGQGALYLDGDLQKARDLFEQAQTLYKKIGDRRGLADAMFYLGQVALQYSNFATAQKLCEQSLIVFQELDDLEKVADCHNILGILAVVQDHYTLASYHLKQALQLYQELQSKSGIASIYDWLGQMAFKQGDYVTARVNFEQSVQFWREVGARAGHAYMLNVLARALIELGELEQAQAALSESLALRMEIGNKGGIAASLEVMASIAARSDPQRALRLLGAATTIREQNNIPLPLYECAYCDRTLALAESKLSRQEYEAALAAGSAMTFEAAIAETLPD